MPAPAGVGGYPRNDGDGRDGRPPASPADFETVRSFRGAGVTEDVLSGSWDVLTGYVQGRLTR